MKISDEIGNRSPAQFLTDKKKRWRDAEAERKNIEYTIKTTSRGFGMVTVTFSPDRYGNGARGVCRSRYLELNDTEIDLFKRLLKRELEAAIENEKQTKQEFEQVLKWFYTT